MVTAVAAWSIWGGEMFPASDPTGGNRDLSPLCDILIWYTDPSMWADSELKTWLEKVRTPFHSLLVSGPLMSAAPKWLTSSKRGLLPDKKASREKLLERVRANMRPPART